MNIVKGLAASAAIAMLAAQPVAAANSASKLSLSNVAKGEVRAASKSGKSKAAAGIPLFLIIAGAVAAVVVVVAVADGGSDSN
jgi:hypothetical protein